jgi:hypothetical protein
MKRNNVKTIYIKDFSKFPGPRYKKLGDNSGEAFREDVLIPAIKENIEIKVNLDGVAGYGSSFLDEAFAGLIRSGISPRKVTEIVNNLESEDPELVKEINEYVGDEIKKL